MVSKFDKLNPGERVRVRESVAAPSRGAWNIVTEGRILDLRVEKHSPLLNRFAGADSGEYPLTRLRLLTDDGTCTDLVLDQNAVIEVLK